MNRYPEYLEVNDKKFKINTDFRLALKCDEIFRDASIGDYEKTLAIIYILLGDAGLEAKQYYDEFISLLTKYLSCGKEHNYDSEETPTMDFKQDEGYIKTSFMSDYGKDLDKIKIHWWQFHDLLEGLTPDCVLSRVRAIREEPLSGKKGAERQKLEKAKKMVELKPEKTAEQKELDKYWEQALKKR